MYAGLSGDIVDEQVKNAVGLAAELQRIATSVLPGPGSSKLMLSAGVHCCTATVRDTHTHTHRHRIQHTAYSIAYTCLSKFPDSLNVYVGAVRL